METDNKRAVILFSHGSLQSGAGQTLEAQAARLRELLGQQAPNPPRVEIGYLNYSEPLFDVAFSQCVADGATSITVVPYFLVAGYFVKVDLPREIAAVRERFPDVEIHIAEAMRDHPALADALLSCAARAPHPSAAALAGPAALLVMVHGSPKPESNDDMFRVVEKVRSEDTYPVVEVGFMECNEPDIPTAIATCVDRGATRIVAVPYFLHAGRHVSDDLPGLLDAAIRDHPNVQFAMGDYLGNDEKLAAVVFDRYRESQSGRDVCRSE